MDVLRIFDNNSLGSYYKFLVKYEPDYTVRLSEAQEKIVEFVSRKIANGKRIHEIELLLGRLANLLHAFAAFLRTVRHRLELRLLVVREAEFLDDLGTRNGKHDRVHPHLVVTHATHSAVETRAARTARTTLSAISKYHAAERGNRNHHQLFHFIFPFTANPPIVCRRHHGANMYRDA